jgi:ABC-type multidrug transport system fused ATPase/permease subunit
MYLGVDEADESIDAKSPGGIVIEALSNIRTIASLTLEEERADKYKKSLEKEDAHAIRNSATKGSKLTAYYQRVSFVDYKLTLSLLHIAIPTGATAGFGQFV